MSDAKFSLIDINFDGLSEPAVKLIEAVRSAFGTMYEPTEIRRRVKAEAEAALVLAQNRQEISELEVRATQRLIGKETRRQENIESVIGKALNELPEDVSEIQPDEDWVTQFFDHSQDISNDDMQNLWSKILAGEVANPGAFSLKTMRIIKDMSKEDAFLFTKFCSSCWHTNGLNYVPLIFDTNTHSEQQKALGLHYANILHLESLGLIQHNSASSFKLDPQGPLVFSYFDEKYIVMPSDGKPKEFVIGKVLLTQYGQELFHIAEPSPLSGHRDCCLVKIQANGFNAVKVESD